MQLKTILLATAASVTLIGSAHATEVRGWYFGLEGGANWVADNDLTLIARPTTTPITTATPATASFDTGWAVLATVGYGFWSHWRVEAEVGYRANNVDNVATPFGSIVGTDGDLNELTLMANILYDIPLGSRCGWQLSVSAG